MREPYAFCRQNRLLHIAHSQCVANKPILRHAPVIDPSCDVFASEQAAKEAMDEDIRASIRDAADKYGINTSNIEAKNSQDYLSLCVIPPAWHRSFPRIPVPLHARLLVLPADLMTVNFIKFQFSPCNRTLAILRRIEGNSVIRILNASAKYRVPHEFEQNFRVNP